MAVQSDMTSPMPASIATIIQNLANRPNVQSTLIISRKDGSIIHATGPTSQTTMSARPTSGSYQTSDFQERSQSTMSLAQLAQDGVVTSEPSPVNRETTRTEMLAASIVHFVNAAGAVGTTLDLSADENGNDRRLDDIQTGETTKRQQFQHTDRDTDDHGDGQKRDQEVQLLRLRTRRQEIIIFPDANYLCCVVQNAGKYGNSN